MSEMMGFNPEVENTNIKVELVTKRLVEANFLNPDAKQKDQMAERMGNIFGELGNGFKSVADMNATMEDPNRLANHDKAKRNREILSKAVFLAARELSANNPDLEKEFFLGSDHVDNMLPGELRGLGKDISSQYISNPQINQQLNILEAARKGLDFNNVRVMRVLVKEIDRRINKIDNLDIDDIRENGERNAVLVMLDEEKEKWQSLSMVEEPKSTKAFEAGNEAAKAFEAAAKNIAEVTNQIAQTVEAQGKKVEEILNKIDSSNQNESTVPREFEAQLAYVRNKLDYLENSARHTRDLSVGQLAAGLEGLVTNGELLPDVAVEVKSRLKLIDCHVYMRKANGWIEAPRSGADPESPTIGAAATLAEANNHALDRESIEFFLRGEDGQITVTGLPTPVAWDAYQYININYRSVLRDKIGVPAGMQLNNDSDVVVKNDLDLGNIDITYWIDSNTERKKKVDEWVYSKLMKNHGATREEAEKAWFLVKRLALATGENAVFNPKGDFGNDELAEAIYFGAFRRGRDASGRSRGPQITLNDIQGIGNSWLRRKSGVEGVRNPLFSGDIKFGKIGEGSYVEHFSPWLTNRVQPLRDLLLDRQPDPKKICSISFLQGAVVYFDKVAGNNEAISKQLRKSWVKGVLDLAASYENLGWTAAEYGNFKRYVCNQVLSEQKGFFITTQEFEEIENNYGVKKKILSRETSKFFRDVLSSGIESMTGGGAKKKKK